jgi:hypothetical protein
MPFYTPPTSTYETHREVLLSPMTASTIGSYTIDSAYITPVTAVDGNAYESVFEGQVLAMNPVNGKAVPNYSSYGFGVLGVLFRAVNTDKQDVPASIILEGWVDENYCTDNGVFGTVLAATKTALADVVHFVKRETL